MTWSINPPPKGLRCECCGRPISELRPFGKITDPILLFLQFWHGVFATEGQPGASLEGALLVKNYRSDPADPTGTTFASWECEDCITLPYEEYYKRFSKQEPFVDKKEQASEQGQKRSNVDSAPDYVVCVSGGLSYAIRRVEENEKQVRARRYPRKRATQAARSARVVKRLLAETHPDSI